MVPFMDLLRPLSRFTMLAESGPFMHDAMSPNAIMGTHGDLCPAVSSSHTHLVSMFSQNGPCPGSRENSWPTLAL